MNRRGAIKSAFAALAGVFGSKAVLRAKAAALAEPVSVIKYQFVIDTGASKEIPVQGGVWKIESYKAEIRCEP